MNKLGNPLPLFLDARGGLMDGGKIYVGTANADPQTSPITVYWDQAGTIPAAQPLRTSGGYVVNGAQPANVYINADDYSMRLNDQDDAQVFYSPSSLAQAAASFQPLDDDLTAIAAQGSTSYGRALLLIGSQAALRTAIGYPEPLPKTGGTVSGPISRQGAGSYAYGASGGLTGMRIFNPLPVGTTNPATQPGDIVGFY